MSDRPPDSARVVVVGGGVMGCSTLYHLAKLGIRDAVLLERKKLTCGTTWHSAAQVRQLRSTKNLTSLIKYSTELYAALEAETGQATGWMKTTSENLSCSRNTRLRKRGTVDVIIVVAQGRRAGHENPDEAQDGESYRQLHRITARFLIRCCSTFSS